MSYGIKVVAPNGREMIAMLSPSFVIDVIDQTAGANGTRQYSVPYGRQLVIAASIYLYNDTTPVDGAMTYWIDNGNTVQWRNLSISQLTVMAV